jgi:AcrR family transcriptional regulator
MVAASIIRAASQKRRTQKERTATTQRKLLNSAVKLIAAHGIAGVSIPQIAKHAGVTSGAVQHHFGSREALLIAVVAEFVGVMRAQSGDRIVDSTASVEARVAAICEETWAAFNTNHFVAALEVSISLRHDSQSFPQILKLLNQVEAELDRSWIDRFPGLGLSEPVLGVLRHLMQATLRGLVVRRLYRARATSWKKERQLLQAMLTKALVSLTG